MYICMNSYFQMHRIDKLMSLSLMIVKCCIVARHSSNPAVAQWLADVSAKRKVKRSNPGGFVQKVTILRACPEKKFACFSDLKSRHTLSDLSPVGSCKRIALEFVFKRLLPEFLITAASFAFFCSNRVTLWSLAAKSLPLCLGLTSKARTSWVAVTKFRHNSGHLNSSGRSCATFRKGLSGFYKFGTKPCVKLLPQLQANEY